jgi:putative ABC transport system permease protein
MTWIALKMLTGNRGKYLGIILGIAFATLLIAQPKRAVLRRREAA